MISGSPFRKWRQESSSNLVSLELTVISLLSAHGLVQQRPVLRPVPPHNCLFRGQVTGHRAMLRLRQWLDNPKHRVGDQRKRDAS